MGVRAAAAGVAAGSVLMVLAQLPAFVKHLAVRSADGVLLPGAAAPARTARPALLGIGVLAPVVIFTVCRQSQVLIERFLAASLPAGAISHLNYAQKVAQVPMMLSLMICTVTFPVVAKAVADGEGDQARRRVERDLALAGVVVLAGTAVVVAYAPQIIDVLFQRGAFSAADTATTASIMRVYALGLLGQCLVGALGRPFFSAARPTWFPAAAMGAGLLVNAVAGALAVGPWGVYGIAASNALGITVTAGFLLRGLGSRVVSIHVLGVALTLARLSAAAVAACAAGLLLAPLVPGALPSLAAGFACWCPVCSPRRHWRCAPPKSSACSTSPSKGSVMSADTASRDAAPPAPRSRIQPWILMYHSVADPADDPYGITVSPERLDRQLRSLERRGLTGVGVGTLLRARAGGSGAVSSG